jgi:hypothetical protein
MPRATFLRLTVLAIAIAMLQACSIQTEEDVLKEANARFAPEAEMALDKSVTIRWPRLATLDGELMAEAVTLKIPAQYKPEASREWPHTSSPSIESVDITIVLSGMKPWATPPPIHPEVYDGPRLYSSLNSLLGKEPDSMSNPKTRATFETWREHARIHKRVKLRRNGSLSSAQQKNRAATFYRTLQSGAVDPDQGGYLLDGEIGGLRRFSKLYCYSAYQRTEQQHKQILEHKQRDDPSPPGCVVDRDLALYVSPPDASDWVLIECHALGNCDASFQAGQREARLSLWAYDVERWRETVNPVRGIVDSFVTSISARER